MPRLLFTAFLLSICFFLGFAQQNRPPETVMAVSMRRANKPAFTNAIANVRATIEKSAEATISGTMTDMILSKNGSEQCLTVENDDLSRAPAIVLKNCQNHAAQQWIYQTVPSHWQLALDPTYCLATVNDVLDAGGRLTVRPCSDSRALTLLPSPNLTGSYQISGTTYVLDSGVYGYVGLARQNDWSYQYWRWFEEELDVANAQGCDIIHPFTATATTIHQRQLACVRVAKMQPLHTMP